MHFLDVELCCWKPASRLSVLASPGSLRQRAGKTAVPMPGTALWVRYQDSPGHRAPRPSPQVEIHMVFNGCWVKALSCTPEAVGHWQWSSVALIHHSGLQSGLLGRDNEHTVSHVAEGRRGEGKRLLLFDVLEGIRSH